MPIHAITGKPGGGKSYYALLKIVEILRADPGCQIVTNLPVRVRQLAELLSRRYPGENLRVCDRLTTFDGEDEEEQRERLKRFWWYRGNHINEAGDVTHRGVVGVQIGSDVDVRMEYPVNHPVVYVWDEFHLAFNSRDWEKVRGGAMWYASQHRKFGDDVYWVTQYTENVAKQFRVLTQDYTLCRNWSNETWFKVIRPPARLQYQTSQEPPTVKRRSLDSWRSLKLDRELAGCYDTMSGVGVRGRVLPDRVKPKGLPFGVGLALGVVAVVACAVGVPLLAGKAVSATVSGFVSAATPSIASVASDAVAGPGSVDAPAPVLPPVPPGVVPAGVVLPVTAPVRVEPEPVHVVGIAPDPLTLRRGIVMLSDGRVLRLGRDRELTEIGRAHAVVDGQRVTMRPVGQASAVPTDASN